MYEIDASLDWNVPSEAALKRGDALKPAALCLPVVGLTSSTIPQVMLTGI